MSVVLKARVMFEAQIVNLPVGNVYNLKCAEWIKEVLHVLKRLLQQRCNDDATLLQ